MNEENRICGNCRHLHQHYIIYNGVVRPTDCGHCGVPQLHTRRPSQDACANWERRQDNMPFLPA